jgi:hypothetical protein
MPAGLSGDQSEYPLAVGLATHEGRHAQVCEPPVELGKPLYHAVVREQPAVLQKRMGVGQDVSTGAGVADMATNVVPRRSWAAEANCVSCHAAIGCLLTVAVPSAPNAPTPAPSGLW